MEKDYNQTINLPKTDFPMRASLPEREPQFLAEWEQEDLYHALLEKNADKPSFILHDGPPYANGDIHLGHALNKILKDIVLRYKSMTGYKTPYVPGWDTHGLPIERQAIKKLGINRNEVTPVEFRKVCRDFAESYVDRQREQFKRLGVLADWEHPYLTLHAPYEGKQIEIFGKMAKEGYIYKGLKPVIWCADCETALAEAEIEYKDDTTNSIYVKFKVKEDFGKFGALKDSVYFVIWTTTTWTLPGNVAICLNPDFEYSLIRLENGEIYVLATDLIASTQSATDFGKYEVVATFRGRELENMTCMHPFIDRESLVILGDHVTLDAGTGCVHTAPGHGAEDYVACKNYDVPMIVPVDSKGYLNEHAGKFAGLFYEESNEKIIEELKEKNALLGIEAIVHSYPHCWRCGKPIIYRATDQWFASVDGFKEETLKAIKDVEWIPKWGENRIASMVAERSDWCISRQRMWGVPIPVFYCEKCGKPIIDENVIHRVAEIFSEKGSDAWYVLSAEELMPEGFTCTCGGTSFTKETDTMDVWFDSGSSHSSVLETREELSFPADLYLEGNDQYRGWFQSSLLTSVAKCGQAPYKTVLTHGFVIDEEKRKMSKSLGNGLPPLDIIKEYGADILRLWTISSDYKSDIRISKNILKQLSEVYRKIRNTARYILGNIHDFNPDTDQVSKDEMLELDRFVLQKLNHLIREVLAGYESYQYHLIFHAIHNFCVVDMSNFYLDIVKDRLYTSNANSIERRSAQTAMYRILNALVRLLAPALAFTAEEIWKYMPHEKNDDTRHVMLNQMPAPDTDFDDAVLEEKWEKLIAVRSDVTKALEEARAQKMIGQSLAAKVLLVPTDALKPLLLDYQEQLAEIFIVSQVELLDTVSGNVYEGESGLKIAVTNADGEKCERCWMFSKTVGTDAEHPTLCKRCADRVKKL